MRTPYQRVEHVEKDYILVKVIYTEQDQPWYNDLASIATSVELPRLIEEYLPLAEIPGERYLADIAPRITQYVEALGKRGRREALITAQMRKAARDWARDTTSALWGRGIEAEQVRRDISRWRLEELRTLEHKLDSILKSIPEYVQLKKNLPKYERLRDLVEADYVLRFVHERLGIPARRREKVHEPLTKDELAAILALPLSSIEKLEPELRRGHPVMRYYILSRVRNEMNKLVKELGLTTTHIPFDVTISDIQARLEDIPREVAPDLVQAIDTIENERAVLEQRFRAALPDIETYLIQGMIDLMVDQGVTSPNEVQTDDRLRLVRQAENELRRRVFG
jgi:hypothetical protein